MKILNWYDNGVDVNLEWRFSSLRLSLKSCRGQSFKDYMQWSKNENDIILNYVKIKGT